MPNYRKLAVWERSHGVVLQVYKLTAEFPAEEKYGLISQIRWSASSIPANIAEGSGRGSDADFARFLHIALGSCAELDYHLFLASELGLLEERAYQVIADELEVVGKMLNAFIQKLKNKR